MNNVNTNETNNGATVLIEDGKKVESTATTEVQNVEVEVVDETRHESPLNKDLKLKRLEEHFIYELMKIPTASSHEYRMVQFIIMWARTNKIDYDIDDYGNIYLTKGEVGENEFYPCVTAHLDTVQSKQIFYAQSTALLDVKTRMGTTAHSNLGKHEIYVEGFGIGGDDKAGILLCLSMFNHIDVLKACFFLEEEVGCKGSQHLNKEWFDNVGYVIGYDSPDLNRAAYSCSGTKLMNKDFFEKNGLAELCKSHGLVDFRSEPFTDVKYIREKTEIICMNFGTGYYNCHTDYEYCVLEDMDSALDMGVDIINKLGKTSHKMKHTGSSYAYNDADSRYFESLNPNSRVTSYGSGYSYGGGSSYSGGSSSYSGGSTTHTSSTTTSTTTTKTDDSVTNEQIEYIVEKYEERNTYIKSKIEEICSKNGIDFDLFSEVFKTEIEF